jgi:hypothetical protein
MLKPSNLLTWSAFIKALMRSLPIYYSPLYGIFLYNWFKTRRRWGELMILECLIDISSSELLLISSSNFKFTLVMKLDAYLMQSYDCFFNYIFLFFMSATLLKASMMNKLVMFLLARLRQYLLESAYHLYCPSG